MNYDEREGRAGQGRRGAVPDVTLDWQLRALLAAAVSGGLTRLSFFYPLPT